MSTNKQPVDQFEDDEFVSGGAIPGFALEQTEQDKSFGQSFFNGMVAGKELAPFSAMRRAFAQRLGMLYPAGIDPESIDSETDEEGKLTKFSYPGLVQDITIIAYSCWLDEPAILAAGFQPPKKALKGMFEWADKHGLTFPSQAWQHASDIVGNILSADNNAEHELPEGAEQGKD
jgi:hypothetical protein